MNTINHSIWFPKGVFNAATFIQTIYMIFIVNT